MYDHYILIRFISYSVYQRELKILCLTDHRPCMMFLLVSILIAYNYDGEGCCATDVSEHTYIHT